MLLVRDFGCSKESVCWREVCAVPGKCQPKNTWQALQLKKIVPPVSSNFIQFFSPNWQVRVARFYQNSFSFSSWPILFAKLLANPVRQLQIAVSTAGPQPKGSERSEQWWTSTAKVRAQCAPLDLNRQGPIAVRTAGHQRGPPYRWTSTGDLPSSVNIAGPHPPDGMPECMANRLTDRMSEYLADRMK